MTLTETITHTHRISDLVRRHGDNWRGLGYVDALAQGCPRTASAILKLSEPMSADRNAAFNMRTACVRPYVCDWDDHTNDHRATHKAAA